MTQLLPRLTSERRFIWGCLLFAAWNVYLGVSEVMDPEPTSFTRHWGWLRKLLFSLFGATGLAAFWFALAVAGLALARWAWRHSPRIPSDRWYRG
jgi:hypothetical protein